MPRKASVLAAAMSFAAAVILLSSGRPAASSAPRRAEAPTQLDWAKRDAEAIEKLSDYLRVDTSNPPGNETRGVEWFRKIFDAEGIHYETAESAPGRGSIVARLKGNAAEPALILLNHIDVVPVSREFWRVDPFAGTVREGYVWGRGSIDMKSEGIAELMAFLKLRRRRIPLRRDVIFLATADEEAGGDYGAGWVVKRHAEWIAGGGYLINEGSRSVADASGKPLYFGVGPTEKTPAWLRLTATGRSGHGSIPIPGSAVNKLVDALERLRQYRPPLEVTPPIEAALASEARYEPEPWRGRLTNIREYVKSPNAYLELQAERPAVLALLTNTISLTGLEGSKKINIIPPSATALLDCRLLPGWTINRWITEVRRIIGDDSIQVDVVLNFPPSVSPTDTPLYRTIEKAVAELHPGAGVAQSVETGFTDCHFFRERGITAYGFEPFALQVADVRRVHGNNERIPVKAYTDGVRLMWKVVYDFSRAD